MWWDVPTIGPLGSAQRERPGSSSLLATGALWTRFILRSGPFAVDGMERQRMMSRVACLPVTLILPQYLVARPTNTRPEGDLEGRPRRASTTITTGRILARRSATFSARRVAKPPSQPLECDPSRRTGDASALATNSPQRSVSVQTAVYLSLRFKEI